MDKQKQIEEMANILCEAKEHDCKGENDCNCIKQATALYNAGGRIIPKGSVVLSKEEWEVLTNDLDKGDYGEFESGYAQASKQAVKEFAEKLKSKMGELEYMGVKYKQGVFSDNEIDELAKELGVEIGE